ncbi:MAG: SnoaL-like domain [Solirubrobacterales bacterium]|jgi:ketosteroid isomerase-like protein|nr:SnoaL-like domain [Solirubrobacterales bacterium]
MSQKNVDLFRSAVQAFNDRDIPRMRSIFSEDFVYRLIDDIADGAAAEFRGQDAVLRWWRMWTETLAARVEIQMVQEVNDQVLAILKVELTDAANGAGRALRFGQVSSFRDGRISGQDAYYTANEALKAVGLTE